MYLRVAGFEEESFVDGEGLRFVVFTQGCDLHCKGCHNPQTHDMNGGQVFTTQEIYDKIKQERLIQGVTFSGGEPTLQAEALTELAIMLKKDNYNIWMYSGYTYESLIKKPNVRELLKYIDVLVDGPFILKKKSLELYFCGSSNQRVIKIDHTRL